MKKLYRNTDDKIIAGVCAGFADYLHVDPVLIRIGCVVATILTAGAFIVAYVAAWFLMPVNPVMEVSYTVVDEDGK